MDDAGAPADAGDGSWLTYGQLAEARQIGRRAAVRLAQRHHLRRQPGNDGSVRVWVPSDMAASSPFRPNPPATPQADADATPPADVTPFHAQALAALEDALRAADARADAALALAHKLIAELADAGDRSDLLSAQMAALRIDLDHARAEAQAARDAADAIRQADAGRRARGRLRRVLAAWRGIGIVVLTLASLPANAEQKPIMPVAPGAFGPGTLPCVNWTDHRQHDRDRVPHLMEQAWVSGYLAALAATGWGNALEDITPIRIFSWLDDYCLSHPRETMAEAAVAFARENAR